jgi:hypothetical protein
MGVDWLLDAVRNSEIVERNDRPNETNTIIHTAVLAGTNSNTRLLTTRCFR